MLRARLERLWNERMCVPTLRERSRNAYETHMERLARKLSACTDHVTTNAFGGRVLVEWLWDGSDTPWARFRHALDTPRMEPGSVSRSRDSFCDSRDSRRDAPRCSCDGSRDAWCGQSQP
jgi:hypothetical protein